MGLHIHTGGESPSVSRIRRHIPALDGVRGFAFLLVFVCHYGGGASSSHRFLRFIGEIERLGYSGVSLFFVLSGFLITGILWDSRGTPGYFRFFYIRRVLRIFPLYYAVLLLCVGTALGVGVFRQNLLSLTAYAFFYQNFLLADNLRNVPLDPQHLWSLAVEEQFYIVWPLLLFFARNVRQARLLCLLTVAGSFLFRLIALLPAVGIERLDHNPLSRAGELALGGFLALSLRHSNVEWHRILRVAPFTLAVSFGLLWLTVAPPASLPGLHLSFWLWSNTFFAFFYASILALSLKPLSLAEGFFSTRWLRWLGSISYGLYIFHLLFVQQFDLLAARLVPHHRTAQLLARIPISASLTLFIAILSFHFFESPILRLKSRFAAPRTGNASMSGQPV
jgi:peptidoglycan/LPS O-acetylase OafA/YrhL